MQNKLDLKDKKILYELDKNSRITYSQLAKKVKLKKETVRYRVNRLYSDGIIYKFITIINTSLIGISFYKIFFRLENMNSEQKKAMINNLASNKRVSWIGEIDGIYDLGMTILVENIHKLREFLGALYEEYSENLADKIISINYEGHYYGRNYLIQNRKSSNQQKYYESPSIKKEKIDKIDFEILKILSQDSRITSVEISKIIDVSHDAVNQRIKKLMKKGVISGYSIILNNDKMSQLNYKILLKLRNTTKGKLERIHQYISSIPNITYIVDSMLGWDIDFEMEIDDVRKFREIMLGITNNFSGLITEHVYLLIYNFKKYTYLSANYEYEDYIKNVL